MNEQILNLMSFLCNYGDLSKSVEELYAQWVLNLSYVPEMKNIPLYFEIIKNIKASNLSKEVMNKSLQIFLERRPV